jgi:hypothetical protein
MAAVDWGSIDEVVRYCWGGCWYCDVGIIW